jgi:hypothetical protein
LSNPTLSPLVAEEAPVPALDVEAMQPAAKPMYPTCTWIGLLVVGDGVPVEHKGEAVRHTICTALSL